MPLDLRLLVLFEDGVDARCVHGGPSSNHFAAARTVACAMRPSRVPAHASYVRTHDTIIPYGKRAGGTVLGRLLTHTHLHLYSLRLRVGHPAQPTAASSLSLSTPDDTSPALHCTSCTTSPLSKRHCFHHMRDPIVLSRRASARGGRVASVRSCGRAHADLPLCPPRPLG